MTNLYMLFLYNIKNTIEKLSKYTIREPVELAVIVIGILWYLRWNISWPPNLTRGSFALHFSIFFSLSLPLFLSRSILRTVSCNVRYDDSINLWQQISFNVASDCDSLWPVVFSVCVFMCICLCASASVFFLSCFLSAVIVRPVHITIETNAKLGFCYV